MNDDFDTIDWTDPEVRAQLWADSQVLQEAINSGLLDAETAAELQLGIGGSGGLARRDLNKPLFALGNGDRNLIVSGLGMLLAAARGEGGPEYVADADEVAALRDRIRGKVTA